MAEIIDFSKLKDEKKTTTEIDVAEQPNFDIPFQVVYKNDKAFALVLVPNVVIFAPDVAGVVAADKDGRFDFSMMLSNDMEKLRLYQWDSKTMRVYAYEYNLFPSAPFNDIDGFGHIVCEYIALQGPHIGKIGRMPREEFIEQFKPYAK